MGEYGCIRPRIIKRPAGTSGYSPHIFDRFYRVSPSRNTRGAGLGLAIALDMLYAHGGNIKVESKTGKGTSFIVQLPGLFETT